MKNLIYILIAVLGFSVSAHAGLTSGDTLTLEIQDMSKDGIAGTAVSQSVTVDSNNQVSATFSDDDLSDCSATNFYVKSTLKNAAGEVVYSGFGPAKFSNQASKLGLNASSKKVAVAIDAVLPDIRANGQTLSPIYTAFLMALLNNPKPFTDADAAIVAKMAKVVVLGSDSNDTKSLIAEFRARLVISEGSESAADAKLAVFEQNVVCGTSEVAVTMHDYAQTHFEANEQSVATNRTKKLARAGVLLADITISAALEAGIDPADFLYAFKKADERATNAENDSAFANVGYESFSDAGDMSLGIVLENFYRSLEKKIVARQYKLALSSDELALSGADAATMTTALDELIAGIQEVEEANAELFMQDSFNDNDFAAFDTAITEKFNAFDTAMTPSEESLTRLRNELKEALPADAQNDPEAVSHINAFCTGCRINEVALMTTLLEKDLQYTAPSRESLGVPSVFPKRGFLEQGGGDGDDTGQRHQIDEQMPAKLKNLFGFLETSDELNQAEYEFFTQDDISGLNLSDEGCLPNTRTSNSTEVYSASEFYQGFDSDSCNEEDFVKIESQLQKKTADRSKLLMDGFKDKDGNVLSQGLRQGISMLRGGINI